jgi:hypothetical protein
MQPRPDSLREEELGRVGKTLNIPFLTGGTNDGRSQAQVMVSRLSITPSGSPGRRCRDVERKGFGGE